MSDNLKKFNEHYDYIIRHYLKTAQFTLAREFGVTQPDPDWRWSFTVLKPNQIEEAKARWLKMKMEWNEVYREFIEDGKHVLLLFKDPPPSWYKNEEKFYS